MAILAITASQVQPSTGEQLQTETAGVAIEAGDVVVKDSATQKLRLADADDLASLPVGTVGGIAVGGGALNQKVTFQTGGTIILGAAAGVVQGVVYALSITAGKIVAVAELVTSDDYICILGVGDASDGIKLNIFNSLIQLP